jgi:IS5 family transposase
LRYPTDPGLLNEAREKLDEIIDTLHKANGKKTRRPRTYRMTARKAYLTISKQRSPRKNQLRQAIKKQLQFSKRNMRIVNRMLEETPKAAKALSQRQQNLLQTIQKLIEQQETMATESLIESSISISRM